MPARSRSLLFRALHRLGALAALWRILIALALGFGAYQLAPADTHLTGRLVAGWDAFAAASLLLLWAAILTAAPDHIRSVATSEDPGRVASFVFIVCGACASFLGVVLLLRTIHALPPAELLTHAGIAVAAVALAWLLLHSVFTLRYAHIFYNPGGHANGQEGGLEFPGGEQDPDYLDFAYFSFVVGMTAQTADVGISSRHLRRMALLHGILSFGFNTAVVALSISGVAGVL
ncbi:DUF1345 domain-containing protein [Hymenobacter persicinus]|uniref:DUF1345 domain-containing protein n=1 Tax=Hymenobacter persicinus TaxID=2025506 RepID=A0A4Q5LDR9_9BACT|nr:DUF1345 domain-containing protein [Hymenobacter persicinus]RYU80239.1 DUF1345 domain-containing protein [Hymenobacter persicinus]